MHPTAPRSADAPAPTPSRVRFLLGPAGSGKTRRCLEEIRAALAADPEGDPLLCLAPKQATFQLERQLLEEGRLGGYTRLHLVSFDRLARLLLAALEAPLPDGLSEEGRLMVLRALLGQQQAGLRVFRATARLPGFARQLGDLLREVQRQQISPARLERQAERAEAGTGLGDKLRDLARLQRAYADWLETHRLQDGDRLLDVAAAAWRAAAKTDAGPGRRFAGLWLDGFAEMTPQEIDLLMAVVPACRTATLAFCLDAPPAAAPQWLSTWAVVGRTFQRVYDRVQALDGASPEVIVLPREAARSRFGAHAALRHLEARWACPEPFEPAAAPAGTPAQEAGAAEGCADAVRVVACPDRDTEAVVAARTILEFVRERGGRFRDTAVLVRRLDGCEEVFRRVFARYDIPLFIDRRRAVAHHPLAELTRYALRTVAFGWAHEDWFGALKTGLVPADDALLDRLENEALARGWRGDTWRAALTLPDQPDLARAWEAVRVRVVGPFLGLAAQLAHVDHRPTGRELAAALAGLWVDLGVARRLEHWIAEAPAAEAEGAIHESVWEQMQAWLATLELAFPDDPLRLTEWLPVLEAGLANLTVGVIPPSLDQVLLGAVDRSRNPELALVLLAGLNEGVFPAPTPAPVLLTRAEREALATDGLDLGLHPLQHVGQERYYGYIACTRARQQLVLTYATQDADGQRLNPSPFVDHVRNLFPGLAVETAPAACALTAAQHPCELVVPLLRAQLAALERGTASPTPAAAPQAQGTAFGPRLTRLREVVDRFRPTRRDEALTPAVARTLYGPSPVRLAVSRLEDFGACPFRFLVTAGLRGEERRRFEFDPRERGSLQHEVLARFHRAVRAGGRAWRDVPVAEAQALIRRLVAEVGAEFHAGLAEATVLNRCALESTGAALATFIGALLTWLADYRFDPTAVEVPFGDRDTAGPWAIALADGWQLVPRGRIDRVDLLRIPGSELPVAVVMDYKSRARTPDRRLVAHGIQLQLLTYGLALAKRRWSDVFGVDRLRPVGTFYVPLRGTHRAAGRRGELAPAAGDAPGREFQHRGRFDIDRLAWFDARHEQGGSGQFSYPRSGRPNARQVDAQSAAGFAALLERTETLLGEFGRRLLSGEARLDPYTHRGAVACEQCACAAVCRVDRWTQPYRVLRDT